MGLINRLIDHEARKNERFRNGECDESRRTGRSTGVAFKAIGMALCNPGRQIKLIDTGHPIDNEGSKNIAELVQNIIDTTGLKFLKVYRPQENQVFHTLVYNLYVEENNEDISKLLMSWGYKPTVEQIEELRALVSGQDKLIRAQFENDPGIEKEDPVSKELMMPIMMICGKGEDEITHIPLRMLDERQAYHNHGQTLRELVARGGISPGEAIAIIEQRPFVSDTRVRSAVENLEILKQYVENYKSHQY